VIAAVALIVYLHQYRKSVNTTSVGVVLLAQTRIEPGTPGRIIGESALYKKVLDYPKASIDPGAIVDPSALAGQVAVKEIFKGDQLTAADFGPATGSISEQLKPDERAVVVPLGTPQQVGGQIGAGSHVDVWVSLGGDSNGAQPVVEEFMQDMYVLGTSGDNVTLRATPRQAGQLIFASANAQLWLVLRPTIGSTEKQPPVITRVNRG